MFIANIKFQREQFSLDAELKLEAARITALLGPSGSGKTTFMRLLAGLEKPTSGFIQSNGKSLYESEKKQCLVPQERKVGFMFQDYALFDHMTVAENIAYGVEKSKQKQVVNQWLARINLNDKGEDYPAKLSGGEKQRVALARVLACDPDVLLLDEPFSALDTVVRHELRREIQRLIQDSLMPVLIATHDLAEARLIADDVSVMVNGRIIRQGRVGEVFRNPGNLAAARALGWQNILPVESTKDNCISAGWGGLNLPEAPNAAVIALGIAKNSIKLGSDQNDISAKIMHIVDLDDHYILEVRLVDQTLLVFEHVKSLKRVFINQNIKLTFKIDMRNIFYE